MGKFICLERSDLTSSWLIEERAGLAYFLESQAVAADELLYNFGSESRGLVFIEAGTLLAESEEGFQMELGASQSIGELSLIEPTRKRLKVTAKEASSLWNLSYEQWLELQKEAAPIAQKLRLSIMKKMSRLLEQSPKLPKLQNV